MHPLVRCLRITNCTMYDQCQMPRDQQPNQTSTEPVKPPWSVRFVRRRPWRINAALSQRCNRGCREDNLGGCLGYASFIWTARYGQISIRCLGALWADNSPESPSQSSRNVDGSPSRNTWGCGRPPRETAGRLAFRSSSSVRVSAPARVRFHARRSTRPRVSRKRRGVKWPSA